MANRKKQIEKIQAKAGELSAEVEALIEELETAYENVPDNIKDSSKGEAMQERIDTLNGWVEQLDEIAEEVL
jgi:predicted RNase H-like nuclease (RuvC/YqgF family)